MSDDSAEAMGNFCRVLPNPRVVVAQQHGLSHALLGQELLDNKGFNSLGEPRSCSAAFQKSSSTCSSRHSALHRCTYSLARTLWQLLVRVTVLDPPDAA